MKVVGNVFGILKRVVFAKIIFDVLLFSILKSHLGKGINRFLTAISRYRIRGDAQFCQLVFFGILYIQLH